MANPLMLSVLPVVDSVKLLAHDQSEVRPYFRLSGKPDKATVVHQQSKSSMMTFFINDGVALSILQSLAFTQT